MRRATRCFSRNTILAVEFTEEYLNKGNDGSKSINGPQLPIMAMWFICFVMQKRNNVLKCSKTVRIVESEFHI